LAPVIVTPRAVEDLHALIRDLGLAPSAIARVQRSLRILERFPLAGRALAGAWAPARFLIGPWPWMILVYVYDEPGVAVFVGAIHVARRAAAASSSR
jgi:hypothetical protein